MKKKKPESMMVGCERRGVVKWLGNLVRKRMLSGRLSDLKAVRHANWTARPTK